MINRFPLKAKAAALQCEDFIVFKQPFTQVVKNHIPTAKDVVFSPTPEQLHHINSVPESLAEMEEALHKVVAGDERVVVVSDCLLLGLTLTMSERVVVVVNGLDALFVDMAHRSWLADKAENIARDCLLAKTLHSDPVTELLNSEHLLNVLGAIDHYEQTNVILVELYPKARSAKEAVLYIKRAAAVLSHLVENRYPLHHLGNGVFALVVFHRDPGYLAELAPLLVSLLKREKLHRVHVGWVNGNSLDPQKQEDEDKGRLLFDSAWQALQAALKRGPFSYCSYETLASPEDHPLCKPPRKIIRRVLRRVRKLDKFALISFQYAQPVSEEEARLLQQSVGDHPLVCDANILYVVLVDSDGEQAVQWARDILTICDKNWTGTLSLTAGVATYPYCAFRKTEIIYNTQKALLHAAFFGAGSATLFDAVSLNISGDIFYGDGDLANAVKEYRRGLVCDPEDVNLHNSLGVAYAMMNRHTTAQKHFEEALALESDNFMALYNYGLGAESRGQYGLALANYEKALKSHQREEEDPGVVNELHMLVGKISCKLGQYDKALTMLLPWYKKNQADRRVGRVACYIGESSYGQGDVTQAMMWLQRAIAYDEFDGASLSLLGKIYHEQGQGDDIALSLIEKSVELEPSCSLYRYRLAKVQVACGLFEVARENLGKCLRNRPVKTRALFQMGVSYSLEGNAKRAGHWYRRALSQEDIPAELCSQIESCLH